MEGNDLGTYVAASTMVVFEGIIATAPKGKRWERWQARRSDDWQAYLHTWEWHERPLASIVRLAYSNHGVQVATLLPQAATAAIWHYLDHYQSPVTAVTAYTDIAELRLSARLGGAHSVWDSDHERLEALGWLGRAALPGDEITLG